MSVQIWDTWARRPMHVRNLAERVTRDAEANGRSGDGDAAAVLSARGRRDEFVKNEAGSGSESMTLDIAQNVFSTACVLDRMCSL